MIPALRIAPMTVADLSLALDWAADEGWNPGLDDAAAFHAADPGGFLMGWSGDTPVAAVSVVRHSPSFAFLGLFICHPEWRGRGYGRALWQAGLALAGDRTIGLDGVVAQQDNYRRAGFVAVGRTIRHAGSPAPAPADDLTSCDAAMAAALDREATGVERPRFLRTWLGSAPTRRSLGLARDGQTVGFGTVRRCRAGTKVGPLTAASADDAQRLLAALAGTFADSPLILDVPESNGTAMEMSERFGLTPVFETARMYRGRPPAARWDLSGGIATLELG